MPATQKLPTTRFFVPITRTEKKGDTLIVEGYAYVNPKVKSDRYNLTRAAMEDASAAYLEFPAIREMHGNNAAGTGLEVVWEERGAKITTEIVDPVAIKKVETKVYRGFSVGVKPTLLRGSDVVKCDWIETSLVDRPADPDAVILTTRGEELPEEVDVEVEDEEEVARAAFADAMGKRETRILRSAAIDTLGGVLYDVLCYGDGDAQTRTVAMDSALNEFRAYILPKIARGEMFIVPDEGGPILRADLDAGYVARADHEAEIQRLGNQISTLQSERDAAQADLTTERGQSAELQRRVTELERTPVATPPVRLTAALERTFQANQREKTEADEAQAELARIDGLSREELQAMPQSERNKLAEKVTRLKACIASNP